MLVMAAKVQRSTKIDNALVSLAIKPF